MMYNVDIVYMCVLLREGLYMAQQAKQGPIADIQSGKKNRPGRKCRAGRICRGYLMTAGAVATIYMLARGFVWLCTLIYAWKG